MTSGPADPAGAAERPGDPAERFDGRRAAGGRSGPSAPPASGPGKRGVSRAGAAWTAVIAGLVVFILLVVFFIQNQDVVQVHYLGLVGPVPLGIALFIAAVAGGVLVAIAGAVRIIQLRAAARRAALATHPSEA